MKYARSQDKRSRLTKKFQYAFIGQYDSNVRNSGIDSQYNGIIADTHEIKSLMPEDLKLINKLQSVRSQNVRNFELLQSVPAVVQNKLNTQAEDEKSMLPTEQTLDMGTIP